MSITVISQTPAAAPADPLAHIAEGLFRPMGVDGVYARTELYTHLVERLEGYITRQRDPKAEIMRFPPVMSRQQLEKSGYLKSFPEFDQWAAYAPCMAPKRRSVPAVDRYGEWRGLDHLGEFLGPGAVPGGLLSRLSHRGDPRPAARGRAAIRHRSRRRSSMNTVAQL